MRVRLATALFVVATFVVACSASPIGPTGPAAPDQVTPDDAVKAAGARATAAAFVRAYASDTGADPRTLARLVDGKRLQRWVHWLGVQDREFPGTISGAVDDDQIGPAAPFELSSVPGSGALLRDVNVQATITFSFQPDDGKTITLSRSLDGPMRLLYDDARGTWGVLDFTRDGIPLSQTFEVVADTVKGSRDGIDLTLDSFVSVPYWQFFIRVSSDRAVRIASHDAELLDPEGARVAVAQGRDLLAPGERRPGDRGGDRHVPGASLCGRVDVADDAAGAGRPHGLRLRARGVDPPHPRRYRVAEPEPLRSTPRLASRSASVFCSRGTCCSRT